MAVDCLRLSKEEIKDSNFLIKGRSAHRALKQSSWGRRLHLPCLGRCRQDSKGGITVHMHLLARLHRWAYMGLQTAWERES